MTRSPSHKTFWGVLAALVLLLAALTWLAPAERTLGQAVKTVYLHVALTRAGTIGLYLAALAGIGLLVTGREALRAWVVAISWPALGLYAAGFVVSLIAQVTAWGGIAWREPRVAGALNVLAAATIVQVVAAWLPWMRARGALALALGIYLVWTNRGAQLVLHPADAIGASTSGSIQAFALGLLAVCLAIGAWIAWRLREDLSTPPE